LVDRSLQPNNLPSANSVVVGDGFENFPWEKTTKVVGLIHDGKSESDTYIGLNLFYHGNFIE
jgi:hypothetical protein